MAPPPPRRFAGAPIDCFCPIAAKPARPPLTAWAAIDRRSGAPVVVYRRPHRDATTARGALEVARAMAGVDHAVLAAIVEAELDGTDVVVAQLDPGGHPLADIGLPPPPAGRDEALVHVLAALAEGLDALHAHGVAHGALAPELIAMTRLDALTLLPVLLGPPDPCALASPIIASSPPSR